MNDGDLILRDAPMFWSIVDTTPSVAGADALVRRAKVAAQQEMIGSTGGKRQRMQVLISALKVNLAELNRQNHGYLYQQAVRELFGEDAWQMLREWVLQHDEVAIAAEKESLRRGLDDGQKANNGRA